MTAACWLLARGDRRSVGEGVQAADSRIELRIELQVLTRAGYAVLREKVLVASSPPMRVQLRDR